MTDKNNIFNIRLSRRRSECQKSKLYYVIITLVDGFFLNPEYVYYDPQKKNKMQKKCFLDGREALSL